MPLSFARMLRLMAILLAVSIAARHTAQAAERFGSKSIHLIVGFTPGGGTDIVARAIAPVLGRELGAVVVVENKPGAGGIIAAEFVSRAEPDGYTLLVASPGPFTISPYLNTLSFDPVTAFTPVSQLTTYPNILVSSAESQTKSFAELVAKAKANPGKYNFASTGVGATPHLAFTYLNMLEGIDLTHVPYRGNPQAVTDVLGGRIDFYIGDPVAVMPYVQAGKLNALAVTTKERSKLFPDIPSMTEVGLPSFDVPLWHGLVGPKGVPEEVVNKIRSALKVAADDPEVRSAFQKGGMDLKVGTPAEFLQLMDDGRARWKHVIEINNIKLE